MGFFDKLKASVGIGGATIELLAPPIATSGSKLPIRAVVHGGKLAQKLDGIDVSFLVEPERNPFRKESEPAPSTASTALGKMPGSDGHQIQPGNDLFFEMSVTMPECQQLYAEAPDRYAALLLPSADDDDPTIWNADGPLPMTDDWESARLFIHASADIPGAIDPASQARVHLIPEAAGPLSAVGPMTPDALQQRLSAIGAERVIVSSSGEQWFAWWARGDGRVVAYSPLQVVCSVRPEGVVRAHDNERIPAPSRFPKQAFESSDRLEGEMEEARAWAERLVAQANAGTLLTRPVGNVWCVLRQLVMLG